MSECAVEVVETIAEPEALAPATSTTSWYYGWLMLPLAMLALVASAPGQTFGVSIFNEPMRLSLGLTYGQLSAAYMIGTLLGALPITYVGSMMDRHGIRKTMLAIVTLFSLACLATSLVQGWLTLLLAFCLLRMLGPGALSFLSSNTLPFWFERRLGMVEGIRQLGMAGAMLFIPAINLALIDSWGWRGAYVFLGVAIWCALFPLFFYLFRNQPQDVGQHLDAVVPPEHAQPDPQSAAAWWGLTLEESLRTMSFWVVTAGTAMFALIHTAVFFCLVPIFQERGLSSQDAAAAMTAFAACLAIMQFTGGSLADYVPAPMLLFGGLAGLGGGVCLIHLADTVATATTAAAVLGASQGAFFGASQPLWARYFGRRHMGKIRGVLMTINVASSSVGPLVAGLTHDLSGSFAPALIAFSILPLPVAVLSLFVAPPVRSATSATNI